MQYLLPIGRVDRARAAKCLGHPRATVIEGSEIPTERFPLVHVVAHRDGVVGSYGLAGCAGIFPLRATALRSFIDVVSATVTVNGASERSTIAAEVSKVTFMLGIWRPEINAGGVPTAAQLAAVVTDSPDRARIPTCSDERVGHA